MRLEGKQFGRYRFERLIGRGAMGEVYLAVDPRIHQQVAVKVLQAEKSVYPATNVAREAERFRREASAIANLRHPLIVPLYDYDETSIDETAITYLVIPYYKEGSFTSWLRRRGSDLLPMEDVVYFVQQAADALQYAHNQQIIHRDVKPSNFLIDTSENSNRPNLLLADFGISKFAMGTTAGGTQSLGTLTYMPPEQLHGRPTYASDQYALAIMAYELLVGRPPFEGPPPVVIRQHMEDQPQPPSMLNPSLPRAIDHVLLRALDKKPENRYPTISEFARALQQALPGTGNIPNIQPESSSGELQRSSEVREAQKDSDIRATLRISPAEAQRGTDRMVNLPGGRQVTVMVPANAYNGQILDFPGLGESSPSGGPAGNLILTLSIEQQELTPLTTPPQPQPKTDVPQAGAHQPEVHLETSSASPRQISEAEMKRYFSTATPTVGIVIAVIGALLLLFGLSFSGARGFIIFGLIVVAIGIALIFAASSGSKPTDEEYDAWLKAQAQAVISRAMMKLGLDPSEITREPLEVHGFILPGMRESSNYRADELRWKKGKDGVHRFSVNVYTFFFPADNHLAAFIGDVNALNPQAHNEKTEEYFYRDIVGATTSDEQDHIKLKKKKYQYRLQRFALRISSGDSVGVSINATPIDSRKNIPSFSIPNSGIDQTVARLRMLLREKKQSGM